MMIEAKGKYTKIVIVLICLQLLFNLFIFYKIYDFEKNVVGKLDEYEMSIKDIASPLNSKEFCQSSMIYSKEDLGNSQTCFCEKKDARIWANSQILSISSEWAGMDYHILEIKDSKGRTYYSVDFYE